MSKCRKTLEIEELLYTMIRQKRLYGCSEVTIGFYNNGHGDEIVDFCTMDSKGIVKCYEIKVSLADFKSKAKLSWYGHYNYLIVTEELWSKLNDNIINEYLPKHVGIAIPCFKSWSMGLTIVKRAKKQDLSIEDEIMIKESLVRSLSYKAIKFRNANNLDRISYLNKQVSTYKKHNSELIEDINNLKSDIVKFENYLLRYYGIDFQLEGFHNLYKDRETALPEKIELTLNDRGKDYNAKVNLNRKENFYE